MHSRYEEAWVQRTLDQAEAGIAAADMAQAFTALRQLPTELFLLLNFERPARWPKLAAWLPTMPPEEDQRLWTGQSGWATMHQACVFLDDVFARFGRDQISANVLDYGCGWGRMLRLLYNRVQLPGIHGADPWGRSMERLANHHVHGKIAQVEYAPKRLPFDVKFDLIYSYSVFTHIGEPSQAAILSAFRDGIADDGMLVLTIRQANFWENAEHPDAAHREELLRLHFSKGFAFHQHPQVAEDAPPDFGNTSMTIEYVKDTWKNWRLQEVQWRAHDPYQTALYLRPA